MASSAILGSGPTRDNGALIRTEQAKPDRVVVLIRGAPGLTAGQAYRLCEPNEPISILEQWTAGYKNYAIVSTVEADETRDFELTIGDSHYTFDVTVKVRGRVVDALTHLREISMSGGVSRFDGIFSEVENALRESAKALTADRFDAFKTRLARVSDGYRTAREIKNGVLILRCDFDARPGAELSDELQASLLLRAWYKEGGKEFVYTKAAISTDPRAQQRAERFIRAMEERAEDERKQRRETFDDAAYEARERIGIEALVNTQQLEVYRRLIEDAGMEPEKAVQILGLDAKAGATLQALSHDVQLPAARPNKEANQPAPGLSTASRALIDGSAFAPAKFIGDRPELIFMAIHSPNDLERTKRLIKHATPQAGTVSSLRSLAEVANGASIGVSLEVGAAKGELDLARRTWFGEPLIFPFSITADASQSEMILTFRVFVEDAEVGRLSFKRKVVQRQSTQKPNIRESAPAARLKRHNRVFLSYSSADRTAVSNIATAYTMAGIRIFWDRSSLTPGEEWRPRIRREIDKCDLFHLCWSQAAAQSEWVHKETHQALTRRRRSIWRRPSITVQMLDGPPWAKHPDSLNDINFDDFARAAVMGYARANGVDS